METDYRLILNHITYGEHIANMSNPKGFEEYKQMAFLLLGRKSKYLFEEDILKNYREGMTLERLFDQEKERFIQGANNKKDGKMQKTWHDLSAFEEIRREDDFFDYFFACKLRHVGLLEIDSFLAYHLDYSFNSNKKEYFRFLNLMMRKHHEKILSQNIVETVKEWIKDNEDDAAKELSGSEKEAKIKGKIKRQRDDKATTLNQEQTALLIYCLREMRVILKDEYLNNKEAGQAFSALTGYSAESLRQNIALTEKSTATKKNVEAVKRALKDILKFIEDEVEPG